MRTQLYNILEILLAKNNIRLHPDEVKLQISSHPSYPSLHALTGVLQHFGIPNVAIRIPTTKAVLSELPDCFIAHLSEDKNRNLVLAEKIKNQIKITYDITKSKRISEESFLELWNGIIVAIEKNNRVKETTISPIRKALKWFLISICILFTAFLFYGLADYFSRAHFALSIVGLVLSIFIVRHELGLFSTIANSFCNISTETSCEASFKSKGAKIFDWIKLSDVCIVAFSSYFLYWFLFFNNGLFSYKAIILCTLIAILFTFYSLYYQYRIVRKWCPLCLGIVVVLWFQTGVILLSDLSVTFNSNDWVSLFLLITAGIISIGIWSFLRPLLERKLSLEKLEIDHYKFKRNFALFNTLHQKEKKLTTPYTPIKGEIVLGNKNAPLEIVLVTSPLCFYCKKAHSDIVRILQSAGDKLKFAIRFDVDSDNKEMLLYQITSTLLHLFNAQNHLKCEKALTEIFDEVVDMERWLVNYKGDSNAAYDSILQKQRAWCGGNKINFTPALFVNGRQFPNDYDRGDLIYFIDDLIEQREIENTLKSEFNVTG